MTAGVGSSDPPRTLANRYVLDVAVGRGGMGVVHRARDRQLDRNVAVKLVSEVTDPEAKGRFLAEARRTAGVRHPSIVEVFDVGEDEGDAFLVMELLEGETLGERIAREGHIAQAEAVVIGAEICDALAAAHDAGLVHRDLKPANVFLLATAEAGRRVKLLDFGIAKRIDGTTARTDPNVLIGTLEYMSPEQIRGGRLDGRADLYALGMTLYRMLTGAPAFAGDNAASLVHQHLDVAPMPLRERAPSHGIEPWLDALVTSLLAKDADARPTSARDVKTALATASTLATATVATVRTTTRMLDEDADASTAAPLELDLGSSRDPRADGLAPPIARVPQRLPAEPEPSAPLVVASPAPAWLEPLSRLPTSLSKRIVFYSLFFCALNVVFFHAAVVPTLLLLACAGVGGAAMWARRAHRGDGG